LARAPRLLRQLRLLDLLGTSSLKKRAVTERLIRNTQSHNHQAGEGDATRCDAFLSGWSHDCQGLQGLRCLRGLKFDIRCHDDAAPTDQMTRQVCPQCESENRVTSLVGLALPWMQAVRQSIRELDVAFYLSCRSHTFFETTLVSCGRARQPIDVCRDREMPRRAIRLVGIAGGTLMCHPSPIARQDGPAWQPITLL
jgi:hypothetical protein